MHGVILLQAYLVCQFIFRLSSISSNCVPIAHFHELAIVIKAFLGIFLSHFHEFTHCKVMKIHWSLGNKFFYVLSLGEVAHAQNEQAQVQS